MTIDLSYVGAKVLAHGREVRLEFRRDSEWPTNTIRPLPVLRPSRTVSPITLVRSGTTLRMFWSMSAWKRGYDTRSDSQLYGQVPPYSLFVYLNVPDYTILRGDSLSLSGSAGAFDDLLRNSGLRTAAFSSSTSDGGTLPPFINASRVKAGGWFDDSVVTDTKTIYYGKNPPSGLGEDDIFYDADGDTSLARLADAFNDLSRVTTPATPHRLLIARGLDLTVPFDITFSRADTGSNPAQCLIGTYEDPTEPSTARPVLHLEAFQVTSGSTNPLHVQGLHITNTAPFDPQNMTSLGGKDSTSCQDCVFERGANVTAGWTDRCIFFADSTVDHGQGPPLSCDRGDHQLVTQCVFEGPGLNSHLVYGLGGARPDSTSSPQAEIEMFDLLAINCGLTEMGRARDWWGYRASCRVIGDKAGLGFVMGVNGHLQEYTDNSNVFHQWSYTPVGSDPAHLNLTVSGATTGEILPGGFVLIDAGTSGSTSWPAQRILVSSYAYSGGVAQLNLASPILDASSAPIGAVSALNARYGAKPARPRNQNHRHLINIRAGWLQNVQNVINNIPLSFQEHDFDGYWMSDSIGVAPYTIRYGLRSAISIGARDSSDGGPDVLDVRFERLTLARMNCAMVDWETCSPEFLPSPNSPPYVPLSNELRLWLDWSISDRVSPMVSPPSQTQNDGHWYIYPENVRRLFADRNIYSSLSVDANHSPQPRGFGVNGFGSEWDGYAPAYQGWRNRLVTADTPPVPSPMDPNSIIFVGPVQFKDAPIITDEESDPLAVVYTLDDFDGRRATVPWGESGTAGTLARLVNAVKSRPLGQWSDAVSTLTIARAVLNAYMPTVRTDWPDTVTSTQFPIGASDYTLPTPTGLTGTQPDDTPPDQIWHFSWTAPSARKYVVGYLLELYLGSSVTPVVSEYVWGATTRTYTLTSGNTYTLRVYSCDGICRCVIPASYTFSVT